MSGEEKSKKVVAVYGGSFDPPHIGHLIVMNWVIQLPGIDEVYAIPTFQNPLKSRKSYPYEDRYKMLYGLAMSEINSKDYIDQFYLIDLRSLCRKNNIDEKDIIYSIDLLNLLKKDNPEKEYRLVIGTDCFWQFSKWKNYEKILQDYGIIIYPRRGNEESPKLPIFPDMNLTANITFVPDSYPTIDLSSTQIREWIREGKNVSSIVTLDVWNYIVKKKLYKNDRP